MTCNKCGKEFELREASKGARPRSKCYKCSPLRKTTAHDKMRAAASAAVQNGISTNNEPQVRIVVDPVTGVAMRVSGPLNVDAQCAQCKSYTGGAPFCNPKCRSLFIERLAAKKRGGISEQQVQRDRHAKSRAAGASSRRRMLERARELAGMGHER